MMRRQLRAWSILRVPITWGFCQYEKLPTNICPIAFVDWRDVSLQTSLDCRFLKAASPPAQAIDLIASMHKTKDFTPSNWVL